MRITVTKKHTTTACRRDSHHCMIADALREKTKGNFVLVDLQSIRYSDLKANNRSPLGHNLYEMRGERKQAKVAAATGLKQGDISKWEKRSQPKLLNLLRLLTHYERTLDDAVKGIYPEYDAIRARQQNVSSVTNHLPATPQDGGDQRDGRKPGHPRSVIDLRAALTEQINLAERHASLARQAAFHAGELAAKPGVFEQPPVARRTPSPRDRQSRRGNR